MSIALARGAIGSAKVGIRSGPRSSGCQQHLRLADWRPDQIVLSFNGIRNGQAIRLSFLAAATYLGGIASVFVGNNVRGTPNFVGNQVRVRFNSNNGFVQTPNGLVVSDPVNFPFDPALPLLVAVDYDNTSPGGLAYNSSGTVPYVTMWYAAGDRTQPTTT
jgi:hypothetical protein